MCGKNKTQLITTLLTSIVLLSYTAIGYAGSDSKHEGSAPKAEASEKKEPATINTPAMKALINAKVDIVLLDARFGKWDDGKRVPGAKQISPDASEIEIRKAAGPDKNKLIVTYCGGLQCALSNKLAERLKAMGYTNVIEYPEGIPGWIQAGGKTETGPKGSMPKKLKKPKY